MYKRQRLADISQTSFQSTSKRLVIVGMYAFTSAASTTLSMLEGPEDLSFFPEYKSKTLETKSRMRYINKAISDKLWNLKNLI